RKDPFYPSNGMDNTTKIWYDKEGMPSTDNPAKANLSTGAACIKNYILSPNVMQNQLQGDNFYYNLWSANNTKISANDNPVIKTIYDPCPVGFKLPASNAFTGFTKTGMSALSASQINGTWDNQKKGWNFYTDTTKIRTIFFPLSGWRNYVNSAVKGIKAWGNYWYGVPYDMQDAQGMNIGKEYLRNKNKNHRAFAGNIRPCQD
ncbi:fimbrillin family protein, partial [Bacteroides fragilis]